VLPRTGVTLALVVAALAAGFALAVGVGSRDDDAAPRSTGGAKSSAGTSLSRIATPREYGLWNDRGCITCHGAEARGTPLGPDLTKVVPRYLARHASPEAARAALVAHMLDPAGTPKMRDDGEVYPNPMPPLERLFGGRRDEAPVLAGMLLRLAK
jgi:mono/diheme cytochrome c family protein